MSGRRYSTDTSYSFSTHEEGITAPSSASQSRSSSLSALSLNFTTDSVNARRIHDWRSVLSKWDQYVAKNRAKVRVLVRRGIPLSIKGEAWFVISGGAGLRAKNPGVYEILVQQQSDTEDCLRKDIHRTFPTNKLFKLEGGQGQLSLYNVLKVYSIMDPEVGYCQGMSFLCGVLVQHMSEEDAFWVLVSIMRIHDLRGMFLHNLPMLKCYLFRFDHLLGAYIPRLAAHFKKENISPLFYCSEWFSTIFAYNFPPDFVTRIWDVVLFEGPTYLLKVALAILKSYEVELLRLHFDEVMSFIKNRATEVDVNLLPVADKFSHFEKTLARIDAKWEGGEKDKILAPIPGLSPFTRNVEAIDHITPNIDDKHTQEWGLIVGMSEEERKQCEKTVK